MQFPARRRINICKIELKVKRRTIRRYLRPGITNLLRIGRNIVTHRLRAKYGLPENAMVGEIIYRIAVTRWLGIADNRGAIPNRL